MTVNSDIVSAVPPAGRDRRASAGACALVLLLCQLAAGTGNAADDAPGAWAIFTATDAIPVTGEQDRWYYWLDAQARYFDLGSGMNQYLVRPAIGYRPGNNVSYWFGYARFRTRDAAGNVVDENRFWQQLSWTAAHRDDTSLSMRVRLEERAVDSGNDTGLVLRFLMKYARPIGTAGHRSLILGLEPFVNLRNTDWGADTGLAQHRIYAGIGWRVSGDLSFETGYMNQYLWRRNAEDRSNHLLVINFRTKF